jgi:hypothetical protein
MPDTPRRRRAANGPIGGQSGELVGDSDFGVPVHRLKPGVDHAGIAAGRHPGVPDPAASIAVNDYPVICWPSALVWKTAPAAASSIRPGRPSQALTQR